MTLGFEIDGTVDRVGCSVSLSANVGLEMGFDRLRVMDCANEVLGIVN